MMTPERRMTSAELTARCPRAVLSGDGDAAVTGVASVADAGPHHLVFAENGEALRLALNSGAGIILAPLECSGETETKSSVRAVIFVPQPRLEFARAARLLDNRTMPAKGVHASAVLGAGVVYGSGVSIGPAAVLEDGVRLGDNVTVGAQCVLMAGCVVGDGARLYPRVTVYSGTRIGARCVVHAGAVLGGDGFGYVRDTASGEYTQFPQQGSLIVGDDVEIGANSTIDRGALEQTVIGDGCKLDNLVHVGHNVRIGRNVVIAAQTGISGSSVIGDGAVIAGQVGIADHVTIGEGVILGAQCGVPSRKKITGPGVLFWGTPARPIQQYLKELATLARSVRTRGAKS